MKYLIILFTLIHSTTFSQSLDEKEENMRSHLWLGIWDFENSTKKFKIDTIGYDDIPRNLEFRGILVEAVKWSDSLGENILALTQTGKFKFKDYDSKDSTNYMIQEKAELNAYLFTKEKQNSKFKRKWKIYDFAENFDVDMYVGFIKRAMTITDLDNDGISEISIPYILVVRGGMGPGRMKIIMYEDIDKYAIRSRWPIFYNDEDREWQINERDYKLLDEKLNQNIKFSEFLKSRWKIYKSKRWRW